MSTGRRCLVGLCIIGYLAGISSVAAQEPGDSGHSRGPSFWHAAAGIITVNAVPWAYNRYVQRWPWAEVGTRVWGENLRLGFMWDDNSFVDNQLSHPYHGSFYLNAARSAGHNFWQSFPFVAVGSASWELFLESVPPSLNDLINTTLGGMAVGEVTYRLSSLLGSSRRPARNSFARELGAFGVSPISRTQLLLGGQALDHSVLARSGRENAGWVAAGRRAEHSFVILNVEYGNPFNTGESRPFDAFEFSLQLDTETSTLVNQVGISGLLARRTLARSRRSGLLLGLYQHYDYYDFPGLQSGGQSLSGALLYRRAAGSRTELRLGTHAELLVLGAVSSDHGHRWRRDYDYGPGAGARLSASLRHDGRDVLRVDGRYTWLHSVYGAKANHATTYVRLRMALPLGRFLGVGSDFAVTVRRSRYAGLPSVTRRIPETRLYLMWPPL